MIRVFAILAMAVLASSVEAGRVPSRKVEGSRDPGARGDITVPYLTNGKSTLGVADGVAPIIYAKPTVNDPKNNGVLPVYNLIYYGSKQSFNSSNPGAEPRKPNQLRPGR